MIRLALPIALFAIPSALFAQEHPYLSRFELIQQPGAVRVEWTMIAGNTCFDTEVWRGTAPEALSLIGLISGPCGSISVPTDFAYTDTAPPELSTLYYRLVLGSAGQSTTRSIVFDQLVTSVIRIVPDRTGDGVDVFLAVPLSANVELRCWDISGKLVFSASRLTGSKHHVPVGSQAHGAFIVQAVTDRRSFTGRFVR
ncbi:MAG: hypothetical protein ABI599_13620 [Flavobacteriales bacterium]